MRFEGAQAFVRSLGTPLARRTVPKRTVRLGFLRCTGLRLVLNVHEIRLLRPVFGKNLTQTFYSRTSTSLGSSTSSKFFRMTSADPARFTVLNRISWH